MKMIKNFDGQYSFLSNFAFCDNLNLPNGESYPTVEHAYQAMKTLNDNERLKIKQCDTPGQAKRMGSKITIVEEWEFIKVIVMSDLVLMKFEQNEYFRELLLLTGDSVIIEGNNWHDNFWGSCSCSKCKSIDGLNHMGKILMDVRIHV